MFNMRANLGACRTLIRYDRRGSGVGVGVGVRRRGGVGGVRGGGEVRHKLARTVKS